MGLKRKGKSRAYICIPNLEVADAFGDVVSEEGWAYVATAIQDSDDLLEATLKGD